MSDNPSRTFRLQRLFGAAAFVIFGLGLAYFTPTTDTSTVGTVTQVDGERKCTIVAEYTVNDVPYVADRASRSRSNCNKSVGDAITIHYLAEDPTQATTAPNGDLLGYGIAGFGALLLLWQGAKSVRK